MKKLGRIWTEYNFIFVLLIIFLIYMVTSSGLTWSGTMNIFRHSAVIGIVALGMGLICLTGEIDLSVGSSLALTAGVSVMTFNATNSIILTLLVALIFGAFCGFINGFFVGTIEMPAFIVTLATMLIYRSFAQYINQHVDKALIGGGSSVYKMDATTEAYRSLFGFGNGKLGTIPIVGLILILVTLLFVFIASNTKYGKKVYAIGSNSKAAIMSGINVPLIKVSVFTIAGLLTGLGAYLWIAMNGSADPATTGNSYEMYAIASVVLGGIAMSGGRGKILGVLFGAMSYTVVDKIIVSLKMDSLINNAIKGVILILVILIQVEGPKIRERLKIKQ